ncbi:hypothetical protein D623_10004088 [Myotis brandtii]|uniref:Uncharacterized protein n=1 Tax=Myotis brandtii TaxID=109478 RepID=S7NU29_MYOBR|nr:hypothetical protein D623_10004088 [Myotis brandtii]
MSAPGTLNALPESHRKMGHLPRANAAPALVMRPASGQQGHGDEDGDEDGDAEGKPKAQGKGKGKV